MLLRGPRRGHGTGWLFGWSAFAVALALEAYCCTTLEYRGFVGILATVLAACSAYGAVAGAHQFVRRRVATGTLTYCALGFVVALVALFSGAGLTQMVAAEIALLPGTTVTCYLLARYVARRSAGVQLTIAATAILSLMMTRTVVSAIVLAAQGRDLTSFYWATEVTAGIVIALAFSMGEIIALLDEIRWELEETNAALNQALEGLETAAKVDPLTGLYNRYAFYSLIDREIVPQTGAVAMLDLVGLKQINDTYGHFAGDKALLSVAQSLRENMREGDYAFRWGGDEFVAIFLGARSADVRARVQAMAAPPPLVLAGMRIELRVSWGIAPFRHDDPETSLAAADRELYRQRRGEGATVS